MIAPTLETSGTIDTYAVPSSTPSATLLPFLFRHLSAAFHRVIERLLTCRQLVHTAELLLGFLRWPADVFRLLTFAAGALPVRALQRVDDGGVEVHFGCPPPTVRAGGPEISRFLGGW